LILPWPILLNYTYIKLLNSQLATKTMKEAQSVAAALATRPLLVPVALATFALTSIKAALFLLRAAALTV